MSQSIRYRSYPQFGDEHELLRRSVREWCQNALYPHVEEWEAAYDSGTDTDTSTRTDTNASTSRSTGMNITQEYAYVCLFVFHACYL